MTLKESFIIKAKISLVYPFLDARIVTLCGKYAIFGYIPELPPGVYSGDVESDILCWEELNDLVDVYWCDNYLLICEDYLYEQFCLL